MSINKYFQEELIALRSLGKEFSHRHPGLAAHLGSSGRDPDVERILEGFAFLTGRLRQKIDDELPELTHTLLNLLYPNFLRAVPASSIVQFSPKEGVTTRSVLPRHTPVEAKEVEGCSCRFRTCYDTAVYPLDLKGLHVTEINNTAVMTLTLSSHEVPLADLQLSDLRFFLHGERNIAYTLYYALLNQVEQVRISLPRPGRSSKTILTLPKHSLTPVGFEKNQELIPYPPNAFPAYRLIQEFLCFPKKFLFVDLQGLDKLYLEKYEEIIEEVKEFEINFIFSARPEYHSLIRRENIQLYCTPVVNLFSHDAAPILVDHTQTEYRIVPEPRHPSHFAVYSVDFVESWKHSSNTRQVYKQFESFGHSSDKKNQGYYRLRLEPSAWDNETELYLSLVERKGRLPEIETLSFELTCTNRQLPAKLKMGDISIHHDDTPAFVNFSNIVPVTPSYSPPLDRGLQWKLISNLSLNYISLINIKALQAVLAVYDFRSFHDVQHARIARKRIEGLQGISSRVTDSLYRGLPVRGTHITLFLAEEDFGSEGELYLFASVLNEFFSMYTTVNTFHQLTAVEVVKGKHYNWSARLGKQTLASRG